MFLRYSLNLNIGISLNSSLTLTSDLILKDDPSSINLTNTNNRIIYENSEHSKDMGWVVFTIKIHGFDVFDKRKNSPSTTQLTARK